MHLILFGFPGSGKTHFGKRLAKQLQLPFIDTDDLIKKQTGLSVRETYQAIGKEKFRRLEQETLEQLAHLPPSVIALGGGTILNLKNAAFLRTIGELIYLKVPANIAINRLLERGIPAFADPLDPIASLEKLYEERKPIYESLATLQVPYA